MTSRLANTVAHFSHCLTVIRREPGEYVEGRYCETKPTTFEAFGCVQPTTPREIELLPEGTRADGAVTIWIDCDLKIGGQRDKEPDRILFRGVEYEARSEADWFHHGAFRRYVCTKAGQ